MKVLVTGATGFVGANLVRALVQNEAIELYITIREASDLWRINEIKEKFHKICIVDLSNRIEVSNLLGQIKPQIIYHLAVYGGFASQDNKDEIIKTNLNSTINLLDAALEHGVQQFINTGSSSEYGIKNHPMSENDICCPVNLYGITKLAATNYCSMIGKLHGFRVCTLRLFSPYGNYEEPMRLYPTIVNALQANTSPRLSNPDSVRDFIEVEKVVSIYEKIISREYEPGDIINVGSGKQQTIEEFYNKIATSMNSKIEPLWNSTPPRAFEPQRWEADISKLRILKLV